MNAKKIIKGIAKTTGKYTAKGLAKGIEWGARGGTKTVDALVTNRSMQKIVTGAGMLAASVMIPSVGTLAVGALALKYVVDNHLLGKDKGPLDEIGDFISMGNVITRNVSNKILSPALNKLDRGIEKTGDKAQQKIDNYFR